MMTNRLRINSRTALAAAVACAACLLCAASAVLADDAQVLSPPSSSANAPAASGSGDNAPFNWTDVPQNQTVPLVRASYDETGYQLYDTAGETILIPNSNGNKYILKFAHSTDGTLYFINTGKDPVLYVPDGGYLGNASAPGDRWYPFGEAKAAPPPAPEAPPVDAGPPVKTTPVEPGPGPDAEAPAEPPVDATTFVWSDLPEGKRVPIVRATFDRGGYELYDSAGETILVPFNGSSLDVMKFAYTASGEMYLVNQGACPVLHVPDGGYLENANVPGSRWYPFTADFRPTYPVYVDVAPSWDAYIAMGWYPGMYCYGGYWGVFGGVFVAMPGFVFSIGGVAYHGWDGYLGYWHGHPGGIAPGYWNHGRDWDWYHNHYSFNEAHGGFDHTFRGASPGAWGSHSEGLSGSYHGSGWTGGEHVFHGADPGSWGSGHSWGHDSGASSGHVFHGADPNWGGHSGGGGNGGNWGGGGGNHGGGGWGGH